MVAFRLKRFGLLAVTGVVCLVYSLFAQPPYNYTNDQLRTLLPTPIVDDHPGWIDMYWKAWEIALAHIYKGTAANGFVPYWMDECFVVQQPPLIYQWDSDFMMMFGRYAFYCWPSIATLENFYKKQNSNGYICRVIQEGNGQDYAWNGMQSDINPPLYSWAEWCHYLVSNDKSRFTKQIVSDRDGSSKSVLDRLILYFDCLDSATAPGSATHGRRVAQTGLYWINSYGSGMDNTTRTGDNWICLSAQMALDAYYIGKIAAVAGNTVAADSFTNKVYPKIKNLVNTLMWDTQDKFYYDTYINGTFSRIKTIASAWPLLAMIPDSAKAHGVITMLLDSAQFWTLCPFPSLAKSDPNFAPTGNYWRGAVWSPTSYATIKGLEYYNDSIAQLATEKFLTHEYKVYQNTGTIYENYSAVNVSQGNPAVSDFVGWGGVGPISLLIEDVIGIGIDAPDTAVTWKIIQLKRNGVSNLHFGNIVASLLAADRANLSDNPVLTITTNTPFKLNVIVREANLSVTKLILPGTTTWNVSGVGTTTSRPEMSQSNCVSKGFLINAQTRTTAWFPAGKTGVVELYGVNGKKIGTITGDAKAVQKKISATLPSGIFYGKFSEK
jgi:Glycosyl hydrolase family 63 C-terminal domain